MPRMRDKLGSVDVRQMVAFVRKFSGGKQIVDDEPAAQGESGQPSNVKGIDAIVPRSTDCRTVRQEGREPSRGGRTLSETLLEMPFRQRNRDRNEAEPFHNSRFHRPLLASGPERSPVTGERPRRPWDGHDSCLSGKVSREQARHLVSFVRAFDPRQARAVGAVPDQFESRFEGLVKEFEGTSGVNSGTSLRLSPPDQPTLKQHER